MSDQTSSAEDYLNVYHDYHLVLLSILLNLSWFYSPILLFYLYPSTICFSRLFTVTFLSSTEIAWFISLLETVNFVLGEVLVVTLLEAWSMVHFSKSRVTRVVAGKLYIICYAKYTSKVLFSSYSPVHWRKVWSI